MRVSAIQRAIASYYTHLTACEFLSSLHKYEVLHHVAQRWDLGRLDLDEMYASCLVSTSSGRLWEGRKHSARESMITLLRHDPHFMRSSWRDLLDQGRDLGMRVGRFLEHCDAAAQAYKATSGHWIDHHHDRRLISLYLALIYPQVYTLIDYQNFSQVIGAWGAKHIPADFEFERCQKLARAAYTIMAREEALVARYQELAPDFYVFPNTMMVHDLFEFCAGQDSTG